MNQDEKRVMANAVNRTADPTSTGYTAHVEQTGLLGTFRLSIRHEHGVMSAFGTLDDVELLGQQILLDVRRHRDLSHLWWTPEVDA